MNIVTLTSDYGNQDYYLAVLKGTLLQIDPGLQLVDINHSIAPFDITRGAYALRNAYNHFPEGTIHVAAVHTHYQKNPRLIATQVGGHFFLGPDNGVLTVVIEGHQGPFHELETQPSEQHSVATCLAYAVEHLLAEKPLAEIGLPFSQATQRVTLQPVIRADQLLGNIVKVDTYGNLMTNIHRNDFDRIGRGRPFALYFKRDNPVEQLSTGYSDVEMGETLCFFNETGFLELAVNLQKASELLGLKQEDSIQIEFYEL
ncbi:MAG: SAM-dependent chlorinase/fluorinase [Bacteroidota bacterium]